MNPELRLRRLALFVVYFVPGLGLASWVVRTPTIRDQLGLSTGQMGLVLSGLSIGSMAGILSSGALVRRFGTRPVIGAGTAIVISGLLTMAIGTEWSAPSVVSGGLFLFGLGMGSADVAVNVEGAEVERSIGRSVLPTVHGCFSLGSLVGSLVGIALTATSFPVDSHLLIVGAVSIPIAWWGMRHVPVGTGKLCERGTSTVNSRRPSPWVAWKDSRLILIGVITLAMALAEGAANDWLPLLMVDGHGFGATAGSLIYAGFAAAMTIGRLGGGYFVDRFGRVVVICASAALGAVGLSVVIFSDNAILAGSFAMLWGLGASLGFPVAISSAGDSAHASAARVSAVSTVGYFAFLVGPPLLGFLGEHNGLRSAMIVVLALLTTAAFLSPAVRQSQESTRREDLAHGRARRTQGVN
ncbi:MFS transporter [Rhodococcus koreensis]|uniref:MFS transporter n=1 Tax=Rhodococcus koreensis TaxID=99653 RepID=UPI0036729D2D